MHNSKEINSARFVLFWILQGLFVCFGYVDMKTYPLTKYYYIRLFHIAFVLTVICTTICSHAPDFMPMRDQFKSELLYYVSPLSNYLLIDLMYFEERLPCQNENWGYNSEALLNKMNIFPQYFFIPTFRFFLEYRPFLPQESLVMKKKLDSIVSHRCTN